MALDHRGQKVARLEGTSEELMHAMQVIQPSLRDVCNAEIVPALKRRAIFTTSLRDKSLAEIPKGDAI